MKTLLHIDTSPRKELSHSRKLSNLFREKWMQLFPDYKLTYRDLNTTFPPHVDLPWIDAAFTPEEDRTAQQNLAIELSDHFVDELLEADTILLSVPMYNFGMPSILKAYIDNIVRVGRTFLFQPEKDQPYTSLLEGKMMYVIIATGDDGYQQGGALESMNHLEPHIRTVFGFIGISDIEFIYTGNDEFGGQKLEKSLKRAKAEIESVLNSQRVEA